MSISSFAKEIISIVGIESLGDIASHGANCGFNGLIYTNDVNKLYHDWEDEILDTMHDYGISDMSTEPYSSINQIISYRLYSTVETIADSLTDGESLIFDQEIEIDQWKEYDWDDLVIVLNRYAVILGVEMDYQPDQDSDRDLWLSHALEVINSNLPTAYQDWLSLKADQSLSDSLETIDLIWEVE